jgi:predicted transcriptional regulator
MTGLSLTDGQIKKIINAANKQTSVTIRLSKDHLVGNHKLPLTETQINRINKTKNGLNLKLSYAQIKHVKKMISQLQKSGGFIPLLTLIPIIASALAAAGGVSSGVANAVSAVKNANAAVAAQEELKRHNREIEKQLKSGEGVVGTHLKSILEKLGLGVSDYNKVINGGCVKCGKGLYLRPYGSGLYIARGRTGSGPES